MRGDRPPGILHWVAWQVVILWLLAVVLALVGFLPALGRRSGLLALAAGVAVGAYVLRRDPAERTPLAQDRMAASAALAGAVVIALGLRLWAALHAGVPLGYDYGFYKAAFEAYEGGVPSDPPHWLDLQFEPALPALHGVLHGVAGLSAGQHLTGLWSLLACALVPAAFVAVRPLAGDRAAAVTALLAAVSVTQIEAYAYLYEKNVVALLLFLVALLLLGRRAWIPAGVLLAGVAILNRPTALLALLALPIVAAMRLRTQWRGWALAAGAGVALALPVWLAWPETFLATGSTVAQESVATLATGPSGSGGTFLERGEYLAAAAAYLPLALVAMALAWRRLALRLPAVVLAVTGLYVVLRLPLHLRFLLMADLAAVLLAGVGLVATVPRRWAWGATAVLVALAAAPAIAGIVEPSTPHVFVTPAQFGAIQQLRSLPADAT
ncbi:MAG: hypothetical protein QOJ26_1762, partial [Thermoplasmata archaeon]|nr:hypothetical protein [Thermoplasmata archaeon]